MDTGDSENEDLLPISALQHLLFCPRQCALIHVERVWAENRFTAEGNLLRRQQYRIADREEAGLAIARHCVAAKVSNCRIVAQRACRECGDPAQGQRVAPHAGARIETRCTWHSTA